MSQPATAPTMADNFFLEAMKPAFREDPYPFYERFRGTAPLLRVADTIWFALGHAEVAAMLRHPRLSTDEVQHATTKAGREPDPNRARSLLFMDPPDHTRLRRPGRPRLHAAPHRGSARRDGGDHCRAHGRHGRTTARRGRHGRLDRGLRLSPARARDLHPPGRAGARRGDLHRLVARHRSFGRSLDPAQPGGGSCDRRRPPGSPDLPRRTSGGAPSQAGRRSPVGARRRRCRRRQHHGARDRLARPAAAGGGPRNDGEPDRQRHAGAAARTRPTRPAAATARAGGPRGRRVPALRRAGADEPARRHGGPRPLWPQGQERRRNPADPGRSQPRSLSLPRAAPPRRHPRRPQARGFRRRHPSLPGRGAGAHGSRHRLQGTARRLPDDGTGGAASRGARPSPCAAWRRCRSRYEGRLPATRQRGVLQRRVVSRLQVDRRRRAANLVAGVRDWTDARCRQHLPVCAFDQGDPALRRLSGFHRRQFRRHHPRSGARFPRTPAADLPARHRPRDNGHRSGYEATCGPRTSLPGSAPVASPSR